MDKDSVALEVWFSESRVLLIGDATEFIDALRARVAPNQLASPNDPDATHNTVGIAVVQERRGESSLLRAQRQFRAGALHLADGAARVVIFVGHPATIAPKTVAKLAAPEVLHQVAASLLPDRAAARFRRIRRNLRILEAAGITIIRLSPNPPR